MTLLFADDAALDALGERFLARSLPKPEWTHAAHLAVAAWLLLRRPEIDAAREMPGLIRAYNEATGVPNSDTRGYHETLTLAWLRGVGAFLEAMPPGLAAHAAVNALLASPLAEKRSPLAYWSEGLLFSPAARRGWVVPDLAPLPF
ncbi:hypothetical protein NON00_08580 [Roseomonas sp. GC11]|uniref:hypothetical protein n=1 Tax=Roseomonas sp. GC11 TaxID=2950546 RepID=UPI00210DFD7B|nr:hypothetical protein [Roseomonas sp. GC11]MCQ4159985.1 hypothetical protein [Roseomonas sp. GC11]